MTGNANRALAGNEWLLRVLVATAVLQTWIVCAGTCGIVLLFAATHSEALRSALGVVSALAEACVRVALHVLTAA